MIPFYKYHAESGTIVARIVVVTESDLDQHAQDGYNFIPAPHDKLDMWIDPLTKEFHKTIPFNLPNRVMTAVGEDYVAKLPKPCWIQVAGDVPQYVESGYFSIPHTEDRVSYSVVGAYTSNTCFVFWRPLDEVKENAKTKIDAAAEAAREALQTPGSGQAMTYLRKADAARAHLAGFPISEAQLIRLQDEATRLGVTVDEAATIIVEHSDAWELRDAQIDSLRLSSKAAVDGATTGKEIIAILDELVWPN